ncbi:hypothetical protein ABU614_00865 [Lysobacter firmicutimachus]|uniref:Uncharacterized protein n=1 Tax=Lysobacter firmicutimachus TaxID=1792846 RepID=A0AAU8MQG6_9GAMM
MDNSLKLHELRERRLDRTRCSLRPLFWGQLAQILFGISFILLATLLRMRRPEHASSIVAGVLVGIESALVLGALHGVDYPHRRWTSRESCCAHARCTSTAA